MVEYKESDSILILKLQIEFLIELSELRQSEIGYLVKRLQNLNMIVGASQSDVPRQMLIDWLNETTSELLKMEKINPETIGEKSAI